MQVTSDLSSMVDMCRPPFSVHLCTHRQGTPFTSFIASEYLPSLVTPAVVTWQPVMLNFPLRLPMAHHQSIVIVASFWRFAAATPSSSSFAQYSPYADFSQSSLTHPGRRRIWAAIFRIAP